MPEGMEIIPDHNQETIEYQSILEDLFVNHPDLPREYFVLSEKQWAFCIHYAETFESKEAARKAGYSPAGNETVLRNVGNQLLSDERIRYWIHEFVKDRALPADAVLARLADIATGSIEDFIHIMPETGQIFFDLRKAEKRGKLHLIKKLRYIKSGVGKGGVEIELHDPIRALELIGKHLGMWDDAAIKINDYTIKVVREGDTNE